MNIIMRGAGNVRQEAGYQWVLFARNCRHAEEGRHQYR